MGNIFEEKCLNKGSEQANERIVVTASDLTVGIERIRAEMKSEIMSKQMWQCSCWSNGAQS